MDNPPFPPHDLAKLVLGYLAEEELMTAYDEFLQASPYLDAYKNEYDRIFMTSLRTILADYRAVKIYVETCKPHSLRKKLLQCYSLLEMVKFLISVVDPQKLASQDNTIDKNSFSKTNVSRIPCCDICQSQSLRSCVCKNKISTYDNKQSTGEEEINNLDRSLETTSLADLPGNTLPYNQKVQPEIEAKKLMSAEKDSNLNIENCNILSTSSAQTNAESKLPSETGSLAPNHINNAAIDSKQKIEEFNTILNLVCNKNVTNEKLYDNLVSNRVSNASSFQDFATGVHGNKPEKETRVPDSSTTEAFIPLGPNTKNTIITINKKRPPQVVDVNSLLCTNQAQPKDVTQITSECGQNKPIDSKIKIISDVRFDKCYSCNISTTAPSVLKGTATSTPALQNIRKLFINGTPGFTQKIETVKSYNYSKDEIMAMPTLIIVPTSGASYDLVSNSGNPKPSVAKDNVPTSAAPTAPSTCEPLFIDVTSTMPPVPVANNTNKEEIPKASEVGLIKTVDTIVHASLPKDNTCLNKPSTPHVLPPIRKSSSTPRRTSHVRVLDFTAPRRILGKPIAEKESNSDDNVLVISDSPVTSKENCVVKNTPMSEINKISKNLDTELKEQKSVKKRNWDEELRALVATHQDLFPSTTSHFKKEKKKLASDTDTKKDSTKQKKSKKKTNSVKDLNPKQKNDVPIKPTINIISASEPACHSDLENEKNINKPNDENHFDTPENERLSLQNEIGVKLNISDLLETPYKQAIYDIQMETPRFLGPDLPGEPISDIKIMNIPTPRFFDTPKPTQATPSSYSSRPTDYSSGGSYYKPDDLDYVHIPEIEAITCGKTASQDTHKTLPTSEPVKKESTEVKSTKSKRPTRKCAKNVSYFNSPNVKNLTKPSDDSIVENATPNTTLREKKKGKPSKSKSMIIKTDKYKSPFKKDTSKNFMKIKPRRVTPTKNVTSKRKNPSDVSNSARKKNISKVKDLNITPAAIAVSKKSRRKSSTPRKLHCTKTVHSSTSSNTSPDISQKITTTVSKDVKICVTHDSDSEQQALRWSDDGSQDAKQKEVHESSLKDAEDSITKIKEYIESINTKNISATDSLGTYIGTSTKNITTADSLDTYVGTRSFHNDLVKRGMDVETARILERDLLDTPPIQDGIVQSTSNEIIDVNEKVVNNGNNTDVRDTDVRNTKMEQDNNKEEFENESDDIEFCVQESNEDTSNYFVSSFDETLFKPKDIVPLKDKFSMEVCIDDGVSIRLRATAFKVLLDQEPAIDIEYDKKEIDSAVTSISNMSKLYTPMKDQRTRCYEIFDSTLTSIDTPLKSTSPKPTEHEPISEIVLEVENISSKTDTKKRKRIQSGASDEGNIKRSKADTQYVLNPANIQNIDIESVLSKLHGP